MLQLNTELVIQVSRLQQHSTLVMVVFWHFLQRGFWHGEPVYHSLALTLNPLRIL